MQLQEQAFLLSHLQKSQAAFEEAVNGVNPDSWLREPVPGRWSVGQCAEHVVIVTERIFGAVQSLADKPEEDFDPEDAARKDELVLAVADRQERFEAPAITHPVSKYGTEEALLTDFRSVYRGLNAMVEQNPVWLRSRFREHPILKALDGYQWTLACSCHTLRHVRQIAEIKQQLAGV